MKYSTPHTMRIDITGKIYCLIVSNPDNVNCRSFFLIHEFIGNPVFMFGLVSDSDTECYDIAIANATEYIPEEWE